MSIDYEAVDKGINNSGMNFVIFDETVPGEFHGHVRIWAQLDAKQQNVLIKAGMVDSRGNVLRQGPKHGQHVYN